MTQPSGVGDTDTGDDPATGGPADAALLAALAAGDHAALATAFDRFAPTLTRYAWALADDRSGVEALVQDSFASLWQHARDLSLDEVGLLPWLLVTCRDHWTATTTPDTPLDPVDARHRLRYVADEVAALVPLARQVVDTAIVGGRPFADAARSLGLPVPRTAARTPRSTTAPRKAVQNRGH